MTPQSWLTAADIYDSHEGLDLYRPVVNPDASRPLWGENQWPSSSDVPLFRQKYERWVERMKELGLIVMEACVSLLNEYLLFVIAILIANIEWPQGSA